jgi:hypothetical protein
VPVLAPPFPEMQRIIEATGRGWIVSRDSDDGYLEAVTRVDGLGLARSRGGGARGRSRDVVRRRSRRPDGGLRHAVARPTGGAGRVVPTGFPQ